MIGKNNVLAGLEKAIANIKNIPQINIKGIKDELEKIEIDFKSEYGKNTIERNLIDFYNQLSNKDNQVGTLTSLRNIYEKYNN